MHHLYISLYSDEPALLREREALEAWCKKNHVIEYCWIEDNLSIGRIPEKLILALLSGIQLGDTVVVSELSRLGRSLPMYLTVLSELKSRNVTIVSFDGRVMTPGKEFDRYVSALQDIVYIEKNIKAFRSMDIISGKRKEGTVWGRPTGSKTNPEKYVLFGKTELLENMLSKGMKVTDIAKELGVSRGTIYNYFEAKKK